ncbi:unnamed protein product [Gordionus sp. m RMFG-2023]
MCRKIISSNHTSSFNLKKHLKTVHTSNYKEIEKYLKSFGVMEEDKPTSKSNLIQTKLTNLDSSTPGVSQKLADKVIMNFIINTVQPLSLVDNDSFIKMINTFSPRTKIFCRQTFMARILESFKEMKEYLILNLSDVSYVCTTADCWTHNRRFPDLYDDDNVIAAIVHPSFKLNWPYINLTESKWQLDRLMVTLKNGMPNHDTIARSKPQPSKDDFFEINNNNNIEPIDAFFKSKNTNLNIFDDFFHIKSLFIKFNTALPSSASAERLFSMAKLILSDRRSRLGDDSTEMLLLLKCNNK